MAEVFSKCPGMELTNDSGTRREIPDVEPVPDLIIEVTSNSLIPLNCPFLVGKTHCNRPFSDSKIPDDPNRSTAKANCRYRLQSIGAVWERNDQIVNTVFE